jgi:putative chitinase
LAQSQVDGFTALLSAMGTARWPRSWAAYGLATPYWETNKTMQPVREAYWLSEDWRKTHLTYFPHYGRGYVQLTWPKNYEKADHELGLGGTLIANLDLAMRPDIAARILVAGMEQGWFTTKKLADYLPIDGDAGFDAFRAARRIINGQDKAGEIAKLAVQFQASLTAGEWA